MVSTLRRWTGSTWELVPNGTDFSYSADGSTFINPVKMQRWTGSAWVDVWLKSDPMTFQHSPTDSESFRPPGQGGWRGGVLIYQESFGFGDHIGCMAFDYAAIKAQLDVRPNVTAARIKIKRENTVHGDSSAFLLLWSLSPSAVDGSNNLITSGQPDLVNGSGPEIGSNVYGRGDFEWETIEDMDFINRFRLETARGLAIARSETLSDPGDENTDYAKFHGWNQSDPPILEFTCDF